MPSSLSVQQLSTSATSSNHTYNNNGTSPALAAGSAAAAAAATSSGSGTVPHSQSAHEIGSASGQLQVPLTPLAQHQQALHHQLQLRFAAAAAAASNGSGSSSGECICAMYLINSETILHQKHSEYALKMLVLSFRLI